MNYTVLDVNRKQIGPITAQEVRELLAKGVVTLDSLAWTPGMAEWQTLRSMAEFIDVPNTPVSASSPYNPYQPPQAAQYFPAGIGSADMNASSGERGRALVEEVRNRGYHVDIFDCIGRGWKLVFSSHFWSILGVHTLTYLTLVVSSMCYAHIVVGGPITGGLDLFFLKKIRGQESDLGTAFSGFSLAFSQLFVTFLMVGLISFAGFILLIIPGIYLAVAYTFAKALVIDKQLQFWDAMECSRKVVSMHWFSIFGLIIVGGLLTMVSVLALIIGVFIAMPIVNAAMMFAYEDIFNPRAEGPRGPQY